MCGLDSSWPVSSSLLVRYSADLKWVEKLLHTQHFQSSPSAVSPNVHGVGYSDAAGWANRREKRDGDGRPANLITINQELFL